MNRLTFKELGGELDTKLDSVKEFIDFIQSLSISEQIGVLQIIQGARLVAESKKKKQ